MEDLLFKGICGELVTCISNRHNFSYTYLRIEGDSDEASVELSKADCKKLGEWLIKESEL